MHDKMLALLILERFNFLGCHRCLIFMTMLLYFHFNFCLVRKHNLLLRLIGCTILKLIDKLLIPKAQAIRRDRFLCLHSKCSSLCVCKINSLDWPKLTELMINFLIIQVEFEPYIMVKLIG